MTERNELVEPRGGWLDTDTLDRMLAGGIHPDDAPPGYAGVAEVLLAVAEAGRGRDLLHGSAHVALAMELVHQRSPVPHSLDRRRRPSTGTRPRKHRGKIGALVVVGAMVGSTGLAAAGVLPDAAQDAFAHVLDKVGITVPVGNDHPASSGEEFPGAGATTDAHGFPKGAETSSGASGGRSRAGQHGSAGTPGAGQGASSEHTPNGKGVGDADTPRESAGSLGMSIADDASQGRSRPASGDVRPSEPPAHASH